MQEVEKNQIKVIKDKNGLVKSLPSQRRIYLTFFHGNKHPIINKPNNKFFIEILGNHSIKGVIMNG